MQKTFVPVVYYLSELNRKMIVCVCRSPLSALHIFYIVTDRMICCLFFSSIGKVERTKVSRHCVRAVSLTIRL